MGILLISIETKFYGNDLINNDNKMNGLDHRDFVVIEALKY